MVHLHLSLHISLTLVLSHFLILICFPFFMAYCLIASASTLEDGKIIRSLKTGTTISVFLLNLGYLFLCLWTLSPSSSKESLRLISSSYAWDSSHSLSLEHLISSTSTILSLAPPHSTSRFTFSSNNMSSSS